MLLALPAQEREDLPTIVDPLPLLDVAVIDGWREEFGNFEDGIARLAEKLRDGGELLLDLQNPHRPVVLRRLLGATIGPLDAPSSNLCPEVDIALDRALDALRAAGLQVKERVAVEDIERWPTQLRESLRSAGLEALALTDGRPIARHWLVATKTVIEPDTILHIVDSNDGRQSETATPVPGTRLRRVTVDELDEEIASSLCDHLVLTRTDDPELLHQLFAALGRHDSPVATRGDTFTAIALRRHDVLRAGPVRRPEFPASVALDDWLLRLGSTGCVVRRIPYSQPASDTSSPEDLERLLAHWEPQPIEPEPMPTAKLSLCMIVRDEERFLDDCLSRAKRFCDELVLVDTGSEDRTIEIAESHGATVIRSEWTEHFAEARQVALDHATGDWILQIDADEFLDPDQRDLLREAITKPGVGAYRLQLVDRVHEQPPTPVRLLRLFRRFDGLRYRGRIHEQIGPALEPELRSRDLAIADLSVRLDHHGAAPEIWKDRRKAERNQRLFELALEEDPADAYLNFLFADHLARLGDEERSDLCLTRSIESLLALSPADLRERPFASEVAAAYAERLLTVGATHDAFALCDEFCRASRISPRLLRVAAEAALMVGRASDALRLCNRLREWRGHSTLVPVRPSVVGVDVEALEAEAQRQLGRTDLAARALQRVAALTVTPQGGPDSANQSGNADSTPATNGSMGNVGSPKV
ncbi:MAG: glycosyltransferase family 2 protein [Planctomycetota bacterium]